MTQPWGTQGQQPGQSGQQWPAPQNWNRPAQAWNTQPYGSAGQPYPYPPQGQQPQAGSLQNPYPQPYSTQAPFGQPGYGQPGSFPPPARAYPPGGPRRGSPLRGLLLGLVLVVGVAIFAISLMHYLTGTDLSDADSGQAANQAQQNTTPVPAPDLDPPEIPQPKTYDQAERWLTNNAVYQQSAPVPTDCTVPQIDPTSASVGKLTSHLNDLTACLWRVWSVPLDAAGFELPRPPVTVYTEPITTGCGQLDDVNAVYCAADQRIYYAQPLWKIFPADQRRLPFVAESVIAHEFGHTIQARTGILISSIALEQKASSSEAKVFSRRLEVQADCLAGMFTSAVGESSGLSQGDLTNLRQVFYSLGDDVLSGQNNVQGDHGLGRSRKAWFTTGQTNTLIGRCNSYTASVASVR